MSLKDFINKFKAKEKKFEPVIEKVEKIVENPVLDKFITDEFIKNNTAVESVEALLSRLNISKEDLGLLTKINLTEIDKGIKELTSFGSIEEMLTKAKETTQK